MSIFNEGGPLRGRRVSNDVHEFSIALPVDADGLLGRQCPEGECSPGYFKIKPGTGPEGLSECNCPYCGRRGDTSEFHTEEQTRYAADLVEREAMQGIEREFAKALGLGPGRRRVMDGGILSIEVSMKGAPPRHVAQPREEVLRRDLTCEHCTLEHAVYGLATWCPDCGKDVFVGHVRRELATVRAIVDDVRDREARLGVRAAVRDVENALEDAVSVFEYSLRAIIRRSLVARLSREEAEHRVTAIGNGCQNLQRAEIEVREKLGLELFHGVEPARVSAIRVTFEKRHAITHHLGVVDRRFLDRVRDGGELGREVWVTEEEVREHLDFVEAIISSCAARAFPEPQLAPAS